MTQAAPSVNLFTESDKWNSTEAEECAKRVSEQFPRILDRDFSNYTANFILADDTFVRGYNNTYCGKNKPTNVLSFPYIPDDGAPEEEIVPLGDVMLAYETIAKEAEEQDKPFYNHFSHLITHGFLHLLGYDHIEDSDSEEMETLEVKILNALNIPDPYKEELM